MEPTLYIPILTMLKSVGDYSVIRLSFPDARKAVMIEQIASSNHEMFPHIDISRTFDTELLDSEGYSYTMKFKL